MRAGGAGKRLDSGWKRAQTRSLGLTMAAGRVAELAIDSPDVRLASKLTTSGLNGRLDQSPHFGKELPS
jgi:hypothetical protein